MTLPCVCLTALLCAQCGPLPTRAYSWTPPCLLLIQHSKPRVVDVLQGSFACYVHNHENLQGTAVSQSAVVPAADSVPGTLATLQHCNNTRRILPPCCRGQET